MTTIVGTEEIYRKLSSQIESQFPEFIREDGPKFVAFLKAYFEYLEQTQKAGDAARGLFDYLDIDRTLDDFVDHFVREYLADIPREAQADRRFLVKYIKDFYRTRGSEESYRFLFRAMFNEEIDMYYPGEDILRASDGRWVQETVVRGLKAAGDPYELESKVVTGQTSGAQGRVQEILRIEASGLSIFQLIVENVSGTFQADELVADSDGNSIQVFNAVGSLQTVDVTNGGAFHSVGDSVTLLGTGGGTATGTVAQTTDQSAVTFQITNGGSGFRTDGNTVLTIVGGNPTSAASIRVLNLSNTETLNICSSTITPVASVTLDTSPFGAGSANLSISTVYSRLVDALNFSNITVGSINTISLLSPGAGYTGSLPTVTALDNEVASNLLVDATKGNTIKGRNATIIASRAWGSISSINILTTDTNFLKNDSISINNNTTSSANTTDTNTDTNVVPSITRGLRRQGLYPATVTGDIKGSFSLGGRYTDTKGFLSWNNKLRDADFYQEFSYVIRVRKLLNEYQSAIKNLVHPAGFKMYGQYRADTGIDLTQYSNTGSVVVTYNRLHTNNVITVTKAANTTMRLTVAPFWLNNGTLKANSGAISVGGQGSNLIFVAVSNTSAANGLYQVNAISSSSQLTLRRGYEHNYLANGYFYYATNYRGTI